MYRINQSDIVNVVRSRVDQRRSPKEPQNGVCCLTAQGLLWEFYTETTAVQQPRKVKRCSSGVGSEERTSATMHRLVDRM